ncbi:MAG: VanZ family protein [Phycisphaeraceae bacterium]
MSAPLHPAGPRSPIERTLDRWSRPLLVIYWPILFLATHWPGLTLPSATPVVQTDKLVHVAVFGLLAWLALRAQLLTRLLGRHVGDLVTLTIVLIYALLDEYTQQFVNRYSGIEDAVTNVIGVLTAYLACRPKHTIPRRDRLAITARWLVILLTPGLLLLFMRPEANPWLIRLASTVGLGTHGADKPGHLYVAALWTFLLATAMPAGLRRPRWSVLITVFVIAASAPLIEMAQRDTGRGFETADVYWHQVGLLAALVAWVLIAGAQPLLTALNIGTRTHAR